MNKKKEKKKPYKKQSQSFVKSKEKDLLQKKQSIDKYYIFAAVGITLITYFNSIFNDFVLNWDDGGYIVVNPVVQAINWENIKIIFTTFDKGNYHPLTTLFYAIEYFFVGDSPMLYHINNLIIHLVNVYLVYILILRINKNELTAFIVSLFFGIHPMHVESVAWISERKDVMYTMFFLLSALYYHAYVWQKGGAKKYLIALVFFFLSLMSKSAAVTLPVVLLLIDFLLNRKIGFKLITEKLPFFALSLLFGILAILSQDKAGAIQDLTPLFSITERLMLASYALISYIGKMFIPINLSAMYSYPDRIAGSLPTAFYLAPFVVLFLFAAVAWSLKKGRRVFFGFAFYLITIALVIQLIPVGGALMAERYTYVPYIGLFFIVGVFVEYLDKHKPFLKNIVLIILGLTAFIFSYLSYERIKVWENGEVLFTDVIKKNPNLPFAYNNRGYLYYRFIEDYDKALADFTKCLSIDPNFDKAYSNRGVLYYNTNRFEEALNDFDNAVRLRPDNTDALRGRANTYSSLKQFEKAIPDYNAYLVIKPDEELIIMWRGTAYYQTQQYELALADFDRTIAINPKSDEAYYWRGLVNYQQRNYEKALSDLTHSLKLNDKRGEVYSWRGLVYFNMEKYEEAISDYSMAIKHNPRDAAAFVNRSIAYDKTGNYTQAFEDIKSAGDLGYPLDRVYFMKLFNLVEKNQ